MIDRFATLTARVHATLRDGILANQHRAPVHTENHLRYYISRNTIHHQELP